MSLVVNNLSYYHSNGEKLFSSVSFSIPKGSKVALVGINGCGKSTLFKILAGIKEPAEGTFFLSPKHFYLPQQFNENAEKTVAEVLGVDKKLKALHGILKGSADFQLFQDLDDDWEIEDRINRFLTIWKLNNLDLNRKIGSLSGGEKTKITLVRFLLEEPDMLLLDEPSNHLDAESRSILYQFIKESTSSILVISHDRALLNQLDVTLELTADGIETYGGNYEFYKTQRELKDKSLQNRLEEQEKNIRQSLQRTHQLAEQRQKRESRGKAHTAKAGLPRIIAGALGSKAQETSSRIKAQQEDRVSQLKGELVDIQHQIKEELPLKIELKPSTLHKGKILVDAVDVNVLYNEKELWTTPLQLKILSGDRVHLLGANGSGKTTFMRLIRSAFKTFVGHLYVAEFSSFYLDQEYSLLDDEKTLVEQLQQYNKLALPEYELKTFLHRHQFPYSVWDKKCKDLSGGEKMKLLLCCMSISNDAIDVLLLDEPTNNIDIYSQEILTNVIKNYQGTIVVVSHDSYFVNQIGINKEIRL